MPVRKIHSLGVIGLALCVEGAVAAAPFDAFNGRWRTDLSSLKFSTVPETVSLKDGIYDCRSCDPPYSLKADGDFHTVAGYPSLDERRVKIIDSRTVRIFDRKAGRITHRVEIKVSRDGRRRTVSWADFYGPGTVEISGRTLQIRVAAGARGAHGASGSWRSVALLRATGAARTETLDVRAGILAMSRATGESYRARIDGDPTPYIGDPAIDEVRLKSAGPRAIIEQHIYRGVVTSTLTMRLSADGKALLMRAENPKTGRNSSARATKL
ncbi:MAG: hypothetical protein P0Y59_00540 [Candidatus Sphingomonas phytovorans]|nr:hypothetical protein [Sphingomonas sp.]WEK00221.1 MAG: hypothetical protein P0Y59_00540 [Sphingomonas sp.]